jgi:hypothetical protein
LKGTPKVLGASQVRVLRTLGPVLKAQGFYLGGGTALAMLLGHRHSLDLDWFNAQRFGDANALAARIRSEGIDFQAHAVGRGTLHGSVARVRVSLLEFPYPMLRAALPCPVAACEMASLDDLAAMKLSAIAQRGSRKDFVDVYALTEKHAPLKQLLDCYARKFSIRDAGHVLYALSYFDDAEREPMPRMLWKLSWQEIKRKITTELKGL